MKNSLYLLSFMIILVTSAVNGQILTNVNPDSGTQCEKLTITVTGENTNFYQGTSILWLEQNGSNIDPSVSIVISPTQIMGEFFFNPGHQIGSYDVHAYNGSGSGNMVLPEGFILNPVGNLPQLNSLMPDTAIKGESIVISIIGDYTHFNADGVYNTAWLTSTNGGYLTATSVTAIDPLHLQANLSISTSQPAGTYALHVNNALDSELVLTNALVVLDNGQNPEIVSAEPNSAYQGEELTITVTGSETNFQQGSSALRLYKSGLGSISPYNHTVVNDTIITGDFIFNYDHNPGMYDVEVMNYPYADHILVDGFELLASAGPPTLLSISPNSAYQGTRITLLINAENTQFDTEGNTASVTLKQDGEELYGKNIVVIDSVTLEADFVFSYSNLTDYRDLIVYTPLDGTMTLYNCFHIIESEPNASIVEVVPDSAYLGDTLVISVTGTGIIFMQGTSQMNLSLGNLTINASNETIVNDTVISGEFSFLNTFPVGKYDVNIDNWLAWPSMSLTEGFTLELFDFIGESSSVALLTVYPNPTSGILNIKRNFNINGICYLKVYDLNGKILFEDQINNGLDEKQIDLTSLTKGIYLLKIIKDGQEQTKQFVIQ